ncbi:MAG: biotin/lipoyl-containing protein, partial [Nitriliruptoraceae bacterium]
ITFIGPSGDVMRALGDKIGAKQLAEQAGVPVAPWSGGAVETVEAALEHGERIGFPLVVKAAAGGGGRGIRIVREPGDLATAFERAREEARRSFGDATVFMEPMVTDARHIEVQIIADAHGTVWAPGVRDCSVQRRNQKVIEESSSTALTDTQADELAASAIELARLAGYTNAGTVEFLYQPATQTFAFLEVNTRLQVEHPVTELTADVDLVKLQLVVAAGGRLDDVTPPTRAGHAIEVRLNAEDVERGFTPAPGTIERLVLPTGPGIRVDTGVSEGDTIPPEYDSMIAKIIAVGHDRHAAISRMRRALAQTTVLVRGGTTNRAFLLDLLEHDAFVSGELDTGWLDRMTADGGYRFTTRADVALIAAAFDAYDAASRVSRERFFAAAARGRPSASVDVGASVDLRYAGTAYRVDIARTGDATYVVTLDGRRVAAHVERLRPFERRLRIGDLRFRIASIAQGADQLVEVDGVPHRISQDDAGLIRAPGPSVVIAVTVDVGDEVAAGASVAVLESMKMETVLSAPFTGRVTEVLTGSNVQIDAGAPVVRLEAIADEAAEAATGDVVTFDALPEVDDEVAASPLAVVDVIRRFVLGYDIDPADIATLLDRLSAADADDVELARAELDVLRIFADLSSLSRNRRVGDAEDIDQSHSAREYLHAFLRSLDADAEGLPESFRAKLRRAVGDYGVDSLDRSPDLEEALLRIHLAQQRASEQVAVVLALLERRFDWPFDDGELTDELRDTLDRLIRATQVRHPVVGDLARRVRYRVFDQPRLQAERDTVYDHVRHHLRGLASAEDEGARQEHLDALVAATQPLLPMLVDPVIAETGVAPMLEVLTHRYYKSREVTGVRTSTVNGPPVATAQLTHPRG